MRRRLPADPLKRVIRRVRVYEGLTWDEMAERLGVTSRTLFRQLRARDLAEFVADRMACRLGLHPMLLWPAEWLRPEGPARPNDSRLCPARHRTASTRNGKEQP